jgi:hypothetical protein
LPICSALTTTKDCHSKIESRLATYKVFVADFLFLFHRVRTALRPSSDLSFAESIAMRALPPMSPPRLPSATAAGFFFLLVGLLECLGIKKYGTKQCEL